MKILIAILTVYLIMAVIFGFNYSLEIKRNYHAAYMFKPFGCSSWKTSFEYKISTQVAQVPISNQILQIDPISKCVDIPHIIITSLVWPVMLLR